MKKSRTVFVVVIMIIFTIVLISCNQSQDGASKAIQDYIQALSNKDAVKISNLSCKDWEQSALLEIDSLTSVGSKVSDLACQQSGQDSTDIYVSCTGTLDLDYNGEAQQIDLSTRTYIVRQEDGEWRMCGYR